VARVVHEQLDSRVPFEHARGDGRDRLAVGDVAHLVLVRVGSGPAREADDVPAAPPELAAQLGPDAGGGSRDDGDAHPRRH
jgi:hypothetical protein